MVSGDILVYSKALQKNGYEQYLDGGYLVIICVRWDDIPKYVIDTQFGFERGLVTTPCLIILPKNEI